MLIIFFTRNRPMQLYAAIESFYRHFDNENKFRIIQIVVPSCKADTEQYHKQYNIVQQDFPDIEIIWRKDFRTDLLRTFFDHRESFDFLIFAVDDCIFINHFDLWEIEKAMRENQHSIGFSLRYGKGLNYNYNKRQSHGEPEYTIVSDKILKYNWTTAPITYNYPLELSSSIYRREQIVSLMQFLNMSEPNILESELASLRPLVAKQFPEMLCYDKPRAFCAPVNKIQTLYNNPAGEKFSYSTQYLADLFDQGKKIDISKFDGFIPNSCHCEVEFDFIER